MHAILAQIALALNALENPLVFALMISVVSIGVLLYDRLLGLTFFVATSLTFVSVHILKALFHIARPADALAQVDGYSFPSMHAALAGVGTMTIAWFIAHTMTKSQTVQIACYAGALLITVFVGWTRLYLGVHRPIDVIVGGIVGIGIGLAVQYVAQIYA